MELFGSLWLCVKIEISEKISCIDSIPDSAFLLPFEMELYGSMCGAWWKINKMGGL